MSLPGEMQAELIEPPAALPLFLQLTIRVADSLQRRSHQSKWCSVLVCTETLIYNQLACRTLSTIQHLQGNKAHTLLVGVIDW